jgi:hypothetical protein
MASQPEYSPPPGAPTTRDAGIALSVAAMVCGAVALLFAPIIIGPIGIVLAAVGKSRGERLANVGLAVAILGTIVGLVLAYVVLKSMGQV